MPYIRFRLPNGDISAGWVCGRVKDLHPCGWCGFMATRQCDYRAAPNLRTCDAWMCEDCATSGRKNIDYCPAHKDKMATQGGLFA